MIEFETARKIAFAYREIEIAKKLLAEITEALARRTMPDLRDAFGRQARGLELGVPTSDTSKTLFNVPWELAGPVIEAHIAQQHAVLALLNERARIELETNGDRQEAAPQDTPQ